MVKKFVQVTDKVGKWSGEIIAPLALLYMAILMFEIVARYFFNAPTKWAHEMSTFIFGAQFMLGGAYCFWRGSMVNVEIFRERMSLRAGAILDAVIFLIPLGIIILMIWLGGEFFLKSLSKLEHTNTEFGPPLYPLRGIIPLAAFLLLTQVVAKFVRDLHTAITGEPLR